MNVSYKDIIELATKRDLYKEYLIYPTVSKSFIEGYLNAKELNDENFLLAKKVLGTPKYREVYDQALMQLPDIEYESSFILKGNEDENLKRRISFNGRSTRELSNERKLKLKAKIKKLDSEVNKDPEEVENYLFRAQEKIYFCDFRGAVEDCNKAIELSPTEGAAFELRGEIKSLLNEYHEAELNFSESIAIGESEFGYDYLERAILKMRLGQYNESIKDFDKALEFHDCGGWSYLLIGFALSQIGKIDEAIKNFSLCIDEGENSTAYLNRGILLEQKGDVNGAQKDYEESRKHIAKGNSLEECLVLTLNTSKKGRKNYKLFFIILWFMIT